MAELTTSERLQPSLLDRLTDDSPSERVESRDKRVMSMRQLRRAVLRDLEWLLNSACRPRDDEIHNSPRVAKSVLNYGMPDLTGLASAGVTPMQIERMVLEAIQNYEPRIVASSLGVRLVETGETSGGDTTLALEITGELCPLPMPEALFVRTEVDLSNGRIELREQTR